VNALIEHPLPAHDQRARRAAAYWDARWCSRRTRLCACGRHKVGSAEAEGALHDEHLMVDCRHALWRARALGDHFFATWRPSSAERQA
jgi:hypothetical protein